MEGFRPTPEQRRFSEADFVEVDEATLELVRSGHRLGRIDVRNSPDAINAAELVDVVTQHEEQFVRGEEAPIKIREAQVRALAREFGFDPDDKEDPIDLAQGGEFMGHDLWVDPDPPLASPRGIEPRGPRIATEFDCQPTRARGVLRYIGRLLWDHPPKVLLEEKQGPWLWHFNHATGRYEVTNRRARGEGE